PFVASELKRFDGLVFDPPRQGAEAQAREIAKSKVPVVVAVSCDAATFARDAKILIEGGYKLESVTPVDQFRYSHHVEIVAKFAKELSTNGNRFRRPIAPATSFHRSCRTREAPVRKPERCALPVAVRRSRGPVSCESLR